MNAAAETKPWLGSLVVNSTPMARQFTITRSEGSRIPAGMEWSAYYVEFGGYFGSHGPHVFAAAPDMLDALKRILNPAPGVKKLPPWVYGIAGAAIAKAEGR